MLVPDQSIDSWGPKHRTRCKAKQISKHCFYSILNHSATQQRLTRRSAGPVLGSPPKVYPSPPPPYLGRSCQHRANQRPSPRTSGREDGSAKAGVTGLVSSAWHTHAQFVRALPNCKHSSREKGTQHLSDSKKLPTTRVSYRVLASVVVVDHQLNDAPQRNLHGEDASRQQVKQAGSTKCLTLGNVPSQLSALRIRNLQHAHVVSPTNIERRLLTSTTCQPLPPGGLGTPLGGPRFAGLLV